MNWFKKAQLVVKDIGEHGYSYYDIGHAYESLYDDGIKKKKIENLEKYPNYMWYYDGENIVAEKETKNTTRHINTFEDISMEMVYAGRYDSSKGEVSIYRPLNKKYQRIPNTIIRKLQEKFTDAVYLYVFDF